MLFTSNSSFGSYDLTTSIGPLLGNSTGYAGGAYNTVGGTVYLAGAFNSDHKSTFTATIQNGTPEPGTWLLALGGLAGVWTTKRYRRAS